MHKLWIRSTFCIAIFALPALYSAAQAFGEPVAKQAPEVLETEAARLPRDTVFLEQAWLSEHNKERARMGYRALVWDAKLAADARKHAEYMAKTDMFEHADQSANNDDQGENNDDQGENMWMGTLGAYSAADMVALWIAERDMFRPGKFPKVTSTHDWTDVGHYTQLIWPDTKRVGCALARNARDEFMVCRYVPAGNVLGGRIGVK